MYVIYITYILPTAGLPQNKAWAATSTAYLNLSRYVHIAVTTIPTYFLWTTYLERSLWGRFRGVKIRALRSAPMDVERENS